MAVRFVVRRLALALAVLPALGLAANEARADVAAANACATTLTPDARKIFDAVLPSMGPGAKLRDLLSSNTRSLAMSGRISMGNARESATAASKCLQMTEG